MLFLFLIKGSNAIKNQNICIYSAVGINYRISKELIHFKLTEPMTPTTFKHTNAH